MVILAVMTMAALTGCGGKEKDLTVYFGDKECPMNGNLKENLKIYEKNGIIALIGENYYLGNNSTSDN